MDIFDAQPIADDFVGSQHFFMMDLAERFNEQLKKQEIFKIKGFFEKRGFLKDVTFEYFSYGKKTC